MKYLELSQITFTGSSTNDISISTVMRMYDTILPCYDVIDLIQIFSWYMYVRDIAKGIVLTSFNQISLYSVVSKKRS